MIRARTSSVDATRAAGTAVASLAKAGDVLVLVGDLGAGKTAFTQGFGSGLGVTEPITSPTFALHQQYRGRLTVNHLDVYRLEQLDEAIDLGLPELLDADAVAVVEWGDAIVALLGPDYLEVRLLLGDGDDDRVIELRCAGSSWSARRGAVRRCLAPWVDDDADGDGASC
jgi:tRNA threonylcarbamoyladenosine biosynthesis protein TsaE